MQEEIIQSSAPVQYERQLSNGKWIECRGNPIPGGGFLAVFRDTTENRRIHDCLVTLASVDELTGISNRRNFLDLAESEFSRAMRHDRPLSFLLLDIDPFQISQ